MHYDEAIHLYYSWRLSNLEGFVHSPGCTVPFKSNWWPCSCACSGTPISPPAWLMRYSGRPWVGLPYFLREYLGRAGALLTGLMLAVSPSLLYFSRFGRNDIIMAFLAVSLFILLWHYIQSPETLPVHDRCPAGHRLCQQGNRLLITLIFGALAFLLAIPFSRILSPFRLAKSRKTNHPPTCPRKSARENAKQDFCSLAPSRTWVPRLKRWFDLSRAGPAVGFLVLLITLTLPSGRPESNWRVLSPQPWRAGFSEPKPPPGWKTGLV